jgi:hypothetical protein
MMIILYLVIKCYKSMWIQCSPGFGGTILQKNGEGGSTSHIVDGVYLIIPRLYPPYPHILVGLTMFNPYEKTLSTSDRPIGKQTPIVAD